MNVDRMLFVKTIDDINYTGEVVDDSFYQDGLIVRISEKSKTMVWIPTERIDCIVFADRTIMDKDDLSERELFEKLSILCKEKERSE